MAKVYRESMDATNDNGLIAVAYSPSIVEAIVGKGKNVKITEETDYPFKGSVKLIFSTSEAVSFPLYLRVPGWVDSLVFNYKDKTKTGKAGTTVRIAERWENGDEVAFQIPLDLRTEKRYNNSLSLLRGPLYFSLRLEKEYKSVEINYDNYGYKGSVDWEIYPKSPWNYGLMIEEKNINRGIKVAENPVTSYPFADKGDMIWSGDSGKYFQWKKTLL